MKKYMVLTRRIYKVATGADSRDKFAARTTNVTSYCCSGPFSPKAAQRAALSAMGTHTCLEALVADEDALKLMISDSANDRGYEFRKVAKQAIELLKAAENASVATA